MTADAGWRWDHSYARLPELFFVRTHPVPVREPRLVMLNHALADSLGLDATILARPDAHGIFAGNQIPEGAEPIAQAYAGHQFGHFTGLGDGRAILLGEHLAPNGARFDIQLKGSGRTPFSRGGDGRAALGPMLREYVISEAMHALGVPTTRSLAVASTGEPVFRNDELPGAVLTRSLPATSVSEHFNGPPRTRTQRHCGPWPITHGSGIFRKLPTMHRVTLHSSARSCIASARWWRSGCMSASSTA